MPFIRPITKTFYFILRLFLASMILSGSVFGMALTGTANISGKKNQDKNFLVLQKITRLVQLEIASQNNSTKTRNEDYIHQACSLAQKTGNTGFLATHLNYAGNKERLVCHYAMALSLYSNGLILAEQQKDTSLIAFFYKNIGVVYRKIGDYQNALKYTVKALRLSSFIKDSLGMARSLNNLGNSQLQLGDYDGAMKSFKESMKMEQHRENKIGLAINLNNIGNVFHMKKNDQKAINYYNLSLEINKQINSRRGMAICYNDLSDIYKDIGNLVKSLDYSQKALAITKEINFKTQEANAYLDMGEIYFKMKQNKRAIQNLNRGIHMMKPLGGRAFLEQSYEALYKIYLELKNYKKALTYLRLTQSYHDSLLNLAVQNNISRLQIQYKFEQKENQIALLDQKARLAEVSVKNQRYLIYILLSASLLMIVILLFAVLLLYRRRQNNRILISKNKEIEDARIALEKNEKELIKAKEEAEKNVLVKSQIMADISHEIRTPLNSVIGFSDLLYKSADNPKQRKYLAAIGASGRSLLKLINEILDSSKQGKDDLSVELSDFDLMECVQEVRNIFAIKAEEKNISLKTSYAKGLPRIIQFNKMVLQQILLNLVGNAIKFTEIGSVTILVSSNKGTQEGLIQLNIEIKDTGVGIPEEEQKSIFEPFHQVAESTKQEGSGLGLSITETLAKRMNGTIRLISKKDKGSRFIVSFNDVKALPETASPNLINSLMANIQKPSFLLLSQKNVIISDIKRLFKEFGFLLLDVGINVSEARRNFQDSLLTVLCCLGQEELANTLSILEKENLKEDHRFLIISKNTENITIGKDKTVLYLSENREKLLEKLKEFLKSYQKEVLEYLLFETKSDVLQNPELNKTFYQIFTHEFKEACSTRMLDNIRQLTNKLKAAGYKFGQTNLVAFLETLNQNIDQFDTHAIDKQLDILERAFIKSFDFK